MDEPQPCASYPTKAIDALPVERLPQPPAHFSDSSLLDHLNLPAYGSNGSAGWAGGYWVKRNTLRLRADGSMKRPLGSNKG